MDNIDKSILLVVADLLEHATVGMENVHTVTVELNGATGGVDIIIKSENRTKFLQTT